MKGEGGCGREEVEKKMAFEIPRVINILVLSSRKIDSVGVPVGKIGNKRDRRNRDVAP